MKKTIFFVLSLTILSLSTSQAAIYKGQRVFKKKCVACHDNGQNFVSKYNIEYWENIMKTDGTPLTFPACSPFVIFPYTQCSKSFLG